MTDCYLISSGNALTTRLPAAPQNGHSCVCHMESILGQPQLFSPAKIEVVLMDTVIAFYRMQSGMTWF
jgi:hypothetical protein